MSLVGHIEYSLTVSQDFGRLAEVDHGGRQQADAGMAVLVNVLSTLAPVVPVKELLAEGAGILQAAEAVREIRTVLERAELAFRIRVVIGNIGAAMCFSNSKIGE